MEPEAKARAIVVARRWTAAGIIASLFASVAWNRPYIPGQFLDLPMMFPGHTSPLLLAILICNQAKNVWLKVGHGYAAYAFLGIPIAIVALTPMNADVRFLLERGTYERAISTGTKYGNQQEVKLEGRKVTYWRWSRWGIDNTMGIVYDPTDRLVTPSEKGNDELARYAEPWRVDRRFARGWYFIRGT